MAGIAGIYCADGRPADLAELKRMTAAVENRGPDGIAYWNSGPVALAHLQFWTTPESLDEHQPLLSPGGEACLTWNGRVDNREELLAELEAAGARPVDSTDAGLALAAYLAWGTDCVQRIVGDFAFAIWDARHRRLWCARDYIGIRPFYYFWDGKTFLFGPEIRALLAHPLVSLKINEGMAGEYLANAITSRDETLYTDIRRLASGSHLTIDGPNRLRIETWWKPELGLLEYRSDEEYADHFRRLFDQSVRSRMRSNMPWGIQLSGGLDSSSIAVSARAVLDGDRGTSSGGEILTFSIACPGKPWDESEDIAAVVEKAGLTPEYVQPMRAGLEFFRRRAASSLDFPGSPNSEPVTMPMFEAASRRGARLLLSGTGGDEWLDGNSAYFLDLVVRLARPGAARELVSRSRDEWKAVGALWPALLARRLLARAAPHWMLEGRRRIKLARHSIFSPQFLERTDLARRISAESEIEHRHFSSRTQQAIFHLVTRASEVHVLECIDREAARNGFEIRLPFFDRKLAEFCLCLPEEQRQRGTVWKLILRNAMRDRLPECVRAKDYKAEFSELFEIVFDDRTAGQLQNLAIRNTDWFHARRLEQWITAATQWDSPDHTGPWPLWMMLGTDLWLEHVLSPGVAGLRRPK